LAGDQERQCECRDAKKRYAPDLIDDPFYAWLESSDNWIKVALLSWAAFFAAGFVAEMLRGGATPDAVQFGLQ